MPNNFRLILSASDGEEARSELEKMTDEEEVGVLEMVFSGKAGEITLEDILTDRGFVIGGAALLGWVAVALMSRQRRAG